MIQDLPPIIQGGMGIAVSDWKLAKSVSRLGQIGIVSGTAINSVLIRRLQNGDKDESIRRALAHFPDQKIVQAILDQYFIPGGKAPNAPFKRAPMFNLKGPLFLWQLTVAASFVEVWLAKEGHNGIVGINLLEKIQLPTLPCLFGAMLADVDLVVMGAGIPREIPRVLDLLSQMQVATLKIDVENSDSETLEFDPARVLPDFTKKELKRPWFFPIVSSATLALNLKKKAQGPIQGFIVEGPKAGGHNAPPRGNYPYNEIGEPIYGERDIVNPQDMVALDLPFYFAGDVATPEKLKELKSLGASGIQVGTLFAFCEESGLDPKIRTHAIQSLLHEAPPDPYGWVYTDAKSSPTGFPFKAIKLEDSLANETHYLNRTRICDLGYLRHLYKMKSGQIVYRCPAEPVADWLKKGGQESETVGKKCLCNALFTDIGLGQIQEWGPEGYLLTAGDDFNNLKRILEPGKMSYTAKDVISYLLT
jgi:NAD(P)H-dependent flavin oxidoreductase YrpB (nitropropane dioxygenase family)